MINYYQNTAVKKQAKNKNNNKTSAYAHSAHQPDTPAIAQSNLKSPKK